jgi:chorismate dehydratase
VSPKAHSRLRIAAIRFLNPAPLMWDFEHPPLDTRLARRYQIDYMYPSECADRLATGRADIGLIPIAALAANPTLRILPGCTIASKGCVRSLLLVRRAAQDLQSIRSVAADTASRTTIAHSRILFHAWGNGQVPFLPMAGDLDRMLAAADAAVLIGDPALLALEDRQARLARTGEQLVYHDIAQEWQALTGLPYVSAIWAIACSGAVDEGVALDFIRSRDHGLAQIPALAAAWAPRLGLTQDNIHRYLAENIHYILDGECLEAMRCFFSRAAELAILPPYQLPPIG